MTDFSLRQERVMENYFFSGIETITHTLLPIAYLEGLQHTFFYGTFREIEAGCTETLQFIRNVYHLYQRHQQVLKPYFLEDLWKRMDTFFEHKDIKHMMNTRYRLTFSNIYRADRFFREVYKKEIIERVLQIPHTLFILSSHIHSLAEQFSQRTEAQMLKFSAEQRNKKFQFSYQLKTRCFL